MITLALPITEISQVADVRRRAADRARAMSLPALLVAQLEIIVSEIATNLVKYADEGTILVSAYEDADGEGLQILALDRGPGIANIPRCLEDGYSTGGSAGLGLGAVRRLSHDFAIASWATGTIVGARIGPGKPRPVQPYWSHMEVPLRGEDACGDSLCIRAHPEGWTAMAADGLGHGLAAADASIEAIRLFRRNERLAPGEIVTRTHEGLRHTRGAAIGVARLDEEKACLSFCGIGNIAASVVAPGSRKQLVSLPGTAGHNARKVADFDYNFPPDALLIMHSDGISAGWSLDGYPGVLAVHPMILVGVLMRDHARARDDVSVLVARRRSAVHRA